MKTLSTLSITTCILLFSLSALMGQNNTGKIKNDLSELKLAGPVKSYTISSFPNKKSIFFDGKGNYMEADYYDYVTGKVKEKYIYVYDVKGQLVAKNKYETDSILSETSKYSYDDKGNRIETTEYLSNKLFGTETYKYDEARNMIQKHYEQADGNLTSTWILKYDANGNNIELLALDAHDSLNFKETFKYDVKGNKIEHSRIDHGSPTLYSSFYKYDIKGNMIEMKMSDTKNAKVEMYYYKYDIKGNMIEESNGSFITQANEYVYDKTGNWTKETEITNPTFTYSRREKITEREIAYLNSQDKEILKSETPKPVNSIIPKPEKNVEGTFIDPRDNITYKIVTIGTQTWMAENLAYKANSGCWAYNDDVTNVAKYGYLYNWETAKTVCPTGWHLPTDAEWTTLTNYLGVESVAGGKLKEIGTTHWTSPNTGATNESGFTALPGGSRYYSGLFLAIGINGYWWSSTENSTTDAWYRFVHYDNSSVSKTYNLKDYGFSVRCVRDK